MSEVAKEECTEAVEVLDIDAWIDEQAIAWKQSLTEMVSLIRSTTLSETPVNSREIARRAEKRIEEAMGQLQDIGLMELAQKRLKEAAMELTDATREVQQLDGSMVE